MAMQRLQVSFLKTLLSSNKTPLFISPAQNTYLETATIIGAIIHTITLQEIDESFVLEAGKFIWIYPVYALDKAIHPNK